MYVPLWPSAIGTGLPRYVCKQCSAPISEAEHLQGDDLCVHCRQGIEKPRPMIGLWSQLTPEQQQNILKSDVDI